MTLQEKHEEALSRMRTKLFWRHKPEWYGLRSETEETLPAIDRALVGAEACLGGLSYRTNDSRRIEIVHDYGYHFTVFVYRIDHNGNEYTRGFMKTDFGKLPDVVKLAIEELK